MCEFIYFLLFPIHFFFLRCELSVTSMRTRSGKVFIHMKNLRWVWSPKHLMVSFDSYEAASRLRRMFLLLLFYTDVPPAKTQAKDTDPALQSCLGPSHHLCQTGEQKTCSCVLCLQCLTSIPRVCHLNSQHNDRVCPAHTLAGRSWPGNGQRQHPDRVMLEQTSDCLACGQFLQQCRFLYSADRQ